MTITHLLEDGAARYGGKSFVLCEGEEFSYQFVRDMAARVATNLGRRGVGPGSKVVVLMGNCLEFMYLFLGLGRIGAVTVPINPMLKSEEIAYIANNADAETLITIPEFASFIPLARQAMPQIQRIFVLGEPVQGAESFDALLEPVDTEPPIVCKPEDEAALIYTSGTTGNPKGVILTHGNYLANAGMVRHVTSMTPSDRFFLVLPLFHVNSQVVSLLAPMTAGADLLLMKKFSPFGILPMIEKCRPTIMSGVPTIYNVMCRMPNAENFDVSSIRFFVSGAAPMPEETYRATQRVLKRPLIMGYGLSEATCATAAADPNDPIKWDSVGPPLRYTLVRIVGPDGIDLPIGGVGEIWTAGPTVMKGYYKNPEATAEVIQGGWLRTGDLGRFDEDGYLYIAGRVKDMIIRGGQNIYPQQVESVISRISGVEDSCVVGVDEPRWGQEVLAVIKRADGSALTERQVMDFCREHLAAYKCPRLVRFVDELPKTATGKIRKVEVAERFKDATKHT